MTQAQQEKTMLRPLGNRVLAKRLEAEEQQGGIILPDSAKKKQETAEVIAVGEGRKNKQGELVVPPVSVGNKILIDKYSGTEVTFQDEEYVIVNGDDVIAIIED